MKCAFEKENISTDAKTSFKEKKLRVQHLSSRPQIDEGDRDGEMLPTSGRQILPHPIKKQPTCQQAHANTNTKRVRAVCQCVPRPGTMQTPRHIISSSNSDPALAPSFVGSTPPNQTKRLVN
jgi:hypothetical protein